jgi:phenylalanyl-tRNA synthetase beta chain
VLPGDFKIKQAKVRGIPSFGMLCSDKELGLATESDGLWLLPSDAPVGQSIREYLDLDDKLFTLKLTPNRSDCSGVSGIAREVAALTGSSLNPVIIENQLVTLQDQLPVVVSDVAACPLYCGRLVRGVNAAAVTPVWMQRRLERSGLRLINAVVDITNYVMMEQGQPMHAFDAALLSGGINVRRAVDGETLTLLNDQTVALDEAVLVIADDARVLALAGIMGGLGSGVEMTTKDVFLEAAFFHPDAIAGRARRFGLATDSSFRFERGVDFAATRRAMERATQLLLEICGGSAGKITEVSGQMPVRAQIKLRVSRVARVLGIPLESGQIADLLRRLQFDFEMSGDHFLVAPPSFRFDLSIEADLVEEVARLYGYDHIPALVPHAALTMLPYSESQRPLAHLQQLMVARDYQEIVSYAFVDEQVERELCGNLNPLLLQNPIASNLAVMRSSLLGGLIGALRFNLNRKQSRVRLFEAGACFAKSGNDYVQTQRLSGIAYGGISHEQWGMESRSVDFYDVKSDLEALFSPHELRFVAAAHPALHPGRSAQICFGDRVVGWIGELHPQWQQQYDMAQSAVWFEVELESLGGAAVPRLNEIPRFLPVRRDLAVLVDESVNVQVLMDVMLQAQLAYVQEVVLFDVYRGRGVEPGKKSLAFRLSLQDTQKTLTDAEIEPVIAQMVEVLNRQGAQLRM